MSIVVPGPGLGIVHVMTIVRIMILMITATIIFVIQAKFITRTLLLNIITGCLEFRGHTSTEGIIGGYSKSFLYDHYQNNQRQSNE